MKKIEISILNKAIHCEGCESRIKTMLGKKKGVISVEPSHVTQIINLEYDDKKINLLKVVKALEKLGYFVDTVNEVN